MLNFLLASFSLCAVAASQHSCNTNLLVNGDFGSPVPLWTVSGAIASATFPTVDVDAAGPSACIQLNGAGPFTLNAPNQFALAATTYEVAFDFKRVSDGCCTAASVAFDVGILTTTSRTTVTTITTLMTYDDVMQRCSGVFAPQFAGTFGFDIVCTNHGVSFQLDNITVRQVSGAYFHMFEDDRRANVPCGYQIWANPFYFVTLFVDIGQASPTPVPGCIDNPVLIGPSPIQAIGLASTNSQGFYASTITVPSIAAGIPLYWQAVALDTNFCSIGCPTMVAFRP